MLELKFSKGKSQLTLRIINENGSSLKEQAVFKWLCAIQVAHIALAL